MKWSPESYQRALCGLEFCNICPDAATRLNRMQAGWAKALLGIRDAQQGPWAVVIAECGWTRRVGTLMYERAIMLKARAALTPPEHPVNQLLVFASSSRASPWLEALSTFQSSSALCEAIPGIADYISAADILEARADPVRKSRLLKQYHKSMVEPMLQDYDEQAFLAAVDQQSWPYLQLQLGP